MNGVLLSPGSRAGGAEAERAADATFGRAILESFAIPSSARSSARPRRSARASGARRARFEQRIADAFLHAQEHAVACGLRPAVSKPKPMQWLTTFQHFRPWTTFMTGVYLFGHLRPAKQKKEKAGLHPQFGT